MPNSLPTAPFVAIALLLNISLQGWGVVSAETSTTDMAAVEAQASAEATKPTPLGIGSVAPSLDIENWVQTGEGRFAPVEKFADGQVYVVEFWATWCGPCVASMPHLSELQQSYADRGVTIISVTDEPLEKVTAFLEREAEGVTSAEGESVTFNDITKAYCLTSDPDQSTSTAYMEAASQNGIPCAFLVGKDGRVEWIGHPMTIDDPLEQVVTGAWDRDAFAAVFKAQQEFAMKSREVMMLAGAGKVDEAMTMADALIADAPTPELAARGERLKTSIELSLYRRLLRTDQVAAVEKMSQLITLLGSDPQAVNAITWMVVQQANRGDVTADLLSAAVAAVDPLIEAGEADASLTDTLSHLVYLQGDLDRAIELAEAASAKAEGRLKVGIDAFLSELKAEKAGPAE